MSPLTGRRTETLRGAIALATAGCALAACSVTQQKAAVLDSATPQAAVTDAATTAPAADGPPIGGGQSADAALSGWLVAIVKADYPAACKLMGQKGPSGGPPTAPTQALCATLTTNKTALALLAGLHKTFSPAGAKPTAASVVVSGLTPKGATADATDAQIKVDGKPLHDVLIANSKGLPAAKTAATFQVSQIGDLWYVTDFEVKG